MSIQDEQELLSLKAVGRIVRMVLDAMKAEVRPPDFTHRSTSHARGTPELSGCAALRSSSLSSHSVSGLDLERTWSVRGWVCRMPRAARQSPWFAAGTERLVYGAAEWRSLTGSMSAIARRG